MITLSTFWWGCTKVTSACKNCYAEELAIRSGRIPQGYKVGAPRLLSKTHNAALLRRWDRLAAADARMRRVFCHSMSDVFDQEVNDDWRVNEFLGMEETDNLWYLLLTKRPHYPVVFLDKRPDFVDLFRDKVWLGTSLGDDSDLRMAEAIVDCPARLHWISYEPAIGELDVRRLPCKISWMVVGGESGKNARPMDIDWAIDAVVGCQETGRKVFVKQLGASPVWKGRAYPVSDSHGKILDEWPEQLRVQEYPEI